MYSFHCLCFLLPFFILGVDSQLVLTPNDPGLTKAIGDDVAVYCLNAGNSPELPEWTDPDGDEIGAIGTGGSTHILVEEDTIKKETKLQINKLKEEDVGTYTCRLPGYIGVTIQIDVYHTIDFYNRENEQVQAFEEYDSAEVRCSVRATPEPTIEWYQNNIRIFDNEEGSRFSISDAGLSISNITRLDEGHYQCRATIRALSETEALDIEVDVQVPPSWLFPPSDEVAAVGSSVEFHCKAEGDPEPNYFWYYDNELIIDDDLKYDLRDNGEYLTIYDLEKADEGGYLCDADNGVRSISGNGDLVVLHRPQGNAQENKTKQEGQEVVLYCQVVLGEESILKWWHNGLEMFTGVQPTNSRITIVETLDNTQLTLTIDSVQRSDQGGYTCEIENEVGMSRITHFVFVEYRPTINTTITRDQVYTWVNNPVNVTCHWEGYPVPKILWKRGGWKLNSTDADFYNFGNGSSSALITPGRLDFGSYVCEATNKVATNTHTIDMVEAFPPTEPLGVTRGEVTSTTLEIEFEEPQDDGFLPIIGYTVEYWARYEETANRDDFNATEDVKLYNLSPDTTYYYRVAAENDVGLGRWSDNITAKTITFRPPRAPRIRNSDVSPYADRIELEWREPEDNGGSPITGYFVRHARVKTPDVIELPENHKEQPLNQDAREHIIADLERDQYYFVELVAESALGEGEPAQMIIRTAQGTVPVTVKPTHRAVIGNVGKLSGEALIGIIAACVVVLLVIVDLSCCCLNNCGLMYAISVACCDRQAQKPDIEMEDQYSAGGKIRVLDTKILVAVIVAAFIVILILVDVCCYCINDCGLMMCVCVQCCGKHTGTHEVDVELAADYSEPYRIPLEYEYDAYSDHSARKEWSS